MTHVLYRFYDAAHQLLYVGITCNPPVRFIMHRHSKDWWSEVARIDIENFNSRDELKNAEQSAIRIERPRYNIQHNGDGVAAVDVVDRSSNTLVGKWFHTTSECDCGARVASLQGQILGEPDKGILLMQLYEWVIGSAGDKRLMTIAKFVEDQPIMYDSVDEMRDNYQHGSIGHYCSDQKMVVK